MMKIRALTLLTVAGLSLAEPVRERFDGVSSEATALALVSEAVELCHGAGGNPVPDLGTSASAARMAAGTEALAIVAEIADDIGDRRLRSAMLDLAGALSWDCDPKPPGERAQVSQAGVVDSDREQLVAPFVARLNEAALQAVGRRNTRAPLRSEERVAGLRDSGTPAAFSSDVGLAPDQSSGSETDQGSEKVKSGEKAESDTATVLEFKVGASQRHRRRLAEWAPFFRREAGALRVARRALQVEIENHSLLESRGACRSFGRIVDGLRPELAGSAPSRELSLRVGRMLDRYRQGAAECVRGRAPSAYSYLSEGDREWVSFVREAARVLKPRALPAVAVPGAVAAEAVRSTSRN